MVCDFAVLAADAHRVWIGSSPRRVQRYGIPIVGLLRLGGVDARGVILGLIPFTRIVVGAGHEHPPAARAAVLERRFIDAFGLSLVHRVTLSGAHSGVGAGVAVGVNLKVLTRADAAAGIKKPALTEVFSAAL
jgi:hypothetical protein